MPSSRSNSVHKVHVKPYILLFIRSSFHTFPLSQNKSPLFHQNEFAINMLTMNKDLEIVASLSTDLRVKDVNRPFFRSILQKHCHVCRVQTSVCKGIQSVCLKIEGRCTHSKII